MGDWDFYVVSGATIDKVLGEQKSIALHPLVQRLSPRRTAFAGLADAVAAEAAVTRSIRGQKASSVCAASEVEAAESKAPGQPSR